MNIDFKEKKDGHDCPPGAPNYPEWGYPDSAHGSAIDACFEAEGGSFWVGNGEYYSAVNFCPYCGEKAKKSIQDIISEYPKIQAANRAEWLSNIRPKSR